VSGRQKIPCFCLDRTTAALMLLLLVVGCCYVGPDLLTICLFSLSFLDKLLTCHCWL
jgi:hypothetical protein